MKQFESYKIHYTESATRVFIDSILSATKAFFKTEFDNLEEKTGINEKLIHIPTLINKTVTRLATFVT